VLLVGLVEGYEYWPSGRLKLRRLTTRNGVSRTWTFEDKGIRWTGYLSDWLGRWFGETVARDCEPSLSSRLCACQELFNLIEARMLDRALQCEQDNAWAFGTITETLTEFKAMCQSILPDSPPRVSFVAWTEMSPPQLLRGFDDVLNLGVLNEAWHRLAKQTASAPVDVLALAQQDADVIAWQAQNGIAAGFAVPLRIRPPAERDRRVKNEACELAETAVVVGHVIVWLSASPTVAESAAITSILWRLGNFIQNTIDRAIESAPIHDAPDWRSDGF
jgi:hypothetical protein